MGTSDQTGETGGVSKGGGGGGELPISSAERKSDQVLKLVDQDGNDSKDALAARPMPKQRCPSPPSHADRKWDMR